MRCSGCDMVKQKKVKKVSEKKVIVKEEPKLINGLLPCPFCGNFATVEQEAYLAKNFCDGKIYYVVCSMRLCSIGCRTRGTKEEVMKVWNHRSDPVKEKKVRKIKK